MFRFSSKHTLNQEPGRAAETRFREENQTAFPLRMRVPETKSLSEQSTLNLLNVLQGEHLINMNFQNKYTC